jgi:hypothetical protein
MSDEKNTITEVTRPDKLTIAGEAGPTGGHSVRLSQSVGGADFLNHNPCRGKLR